MCAPLIRPSGTFSPQGEKERMAWRRLHYFPENVTFVITQLVRS